MLVNAEQPQNAELPIEVILLGIVILVNLEQRANADSPIEDAHLEMAILDSALQ